MAALIWTEPALQDLDAIADYIALDDPSAARELVRRFFQHVEQLQAHPESGSFPPELGRSSRRTGKSWNRPAEFSTAMTAAAKISWCFT